MDIIIVFYFIVIGLSGIYFIRTEIIKASCRMHSIFIKKERRKLPKHILNKLDNGLVFYPYWSSFWKLWDWTIYCSIKDKNYIKWCEKYLTRQEKQC